ncbi:MAG: RecX family transcriptional regulator [bacterium]
MDFVLENNLYKGKEVNKEELDSLSKKSELDILKSKLVEYVYSKPYSKRELFQKLDTYSRKKYKYPLDKDKFGNLFELISSKGYFNSEDNVSKWVTHYLEKNKGQRYIQQKLSQKGYNIKEINKAIESLENKENSGEVIIGLIEKKLGQITEIDEKFKNKVFRYLLSQGFNYDTVKKSFRKYLEDNNLKEVKEG